MSAEAMPIGPAGLRLPRIRHRFGDWLHSGRLDRELAEGADPSSRPQLARRAERLCAPHVRAGVAAGLQASVAKARTARSSIGASAPIRIVPVNQNASEIEKLAHELVETDDPWARGVACARLLVADAGSPLYQTGAGGDLSAAVAEARAALVRRGPSL